MKKSAVSIIIVLAVLMLCACAANTEKDADISVSAGIASERSVGYASGAETLTETEAASENEAAEQENEKVRSGLEDFTNYYEPEDFDRLVNAVSIKPALLQNETHPYHQSTKMKDHIAQYGTVLESWFPLGGRGNTRTLFNDPVISGIAQKHEVSSVQVIIRWHLQAGNICIPGSSNEQHIIEDYDVWDFELTEDEMAQMKALERDERFADY